MTPQEKKEIDFVTRTATKIVIFITIMALVLFTIANFLR